MNSIERALLRGLEIAIAQTPATLTYLSGSTGVTASVSKKFTSYVQRVPTEVGTNFQLDDSWILAKTTDVEDWGLEPQYSIVYVDGQEFILGQNIKKTPVYWKIYLRLPK